METQTVESHWTGQALDCLRQGVLVSSAQGEVTYLNRAAGELFAAKDSDSPPTHLRQVFMEDDHEFLLPNLLGLAARGEEFSGEAMLRRRDGKSFFAYLTMKGGLDVDGQKGGMLLSVEDIDRQKRFSRIFDQPRHQDLVKIAGGIAHELRNPLVGIGGFVTRLYRSCRVSFSGEQYYEYIIANLKRIESLVRKVEDLVTLPQPVYAREEMGELARSAAQKHTDRLDSQKVALEMDVPPALIYLDRMLTGQALDILMCNALDAMPKGGTIRITGRGNGQMAELVFSDNGPGIAPDDLPFIFTPFFSTKADGAGIDLAVLKRIVEVQGGDVTVRSQKGRGATFTLAFPKERRRRIRVALLPDMD